MKEQSWPNIEARFGRCIPQYSKLSLAIFDRLKFLFKPLDLELSCPPLFQEMTTVVIYLAKVKASDYGLKLNIYPNIY